MWKNTVKTINTVNDMFMKYLAVILKIMVQEFEIIPNIIKKMWEFEKITTFRLTLEL